LRFRSDLRMQTIGEEKAVTSPIRRGQLQDNKASYRKKLARTGPGQSRRRGLFDDGYADFACKGCQTFVGCEEVGAKPPCGDEVVQVVDRALAL
jgi:hypothetical protein